MAILQHYYTSCTNKGFQTNAVSEGLDDETTRLLIRIGLYIPPVSMPSQPTKDELKLFPVSFTYSILYDTKFVITNSVYKGQDYSGRYGNYFSHSLITDAFDSAIQNFLPIRLWGSDIWATEETQSNELPSLENLDYGSLINWENIMNFLISESRLESLPYMLTAVIEGLKINKRTIIVDSNTNIALWIGAITSLLPRSLAKRVTFTTYNKNPYSTDVLICGTTADSDFHFLDREVNHEYFVFDFERNLFSEIKDINPFAAIIYGQLKENNLQKLSAFSKFYDEVAYRIPQCKNEIYSMFALFSAADGIFISEDDWQKVIHFMITYDVAVHYPNIAVMCITALGNIRSSEKELVFCVIDLYKKTSNQGINNSIKSKMETILTNSLFLNYSLIATVDDLEIVLEKIKGISLEQVEKELKIKCFDVFLKFKDPAKKSQYFRLLASTKLVIPSLEKLEELLYQGIMPEITEPSTQKLFLETLNTNFRVPFINSFGKYLSSEVLTKNNLSSFPTLSNLAINNLVYSNLVSFTIRESNWSLYCALYSEYVKSKEEKVESFLEFYDNLKKFNLKNETSQELEKAFRATWNAQLPTYDECILITKRIRIEDISKCLFIDSFAEIILHNIHFVDLSSESIEFSEQFMNSQRISEDHQTILKFITKTPTLSGNKEDLEILYQTANKRPFKDRIFYKDIIRLFYRKLLVENKSLQVHENYVEKMIKLSPNEANIHYSSYEESFFYAISEASNVKVSEKVRIFADCFKVWYPLHFQNQVKPNSVPDFLYDKYAKSFYSQKKEIRLNTEKIVCSDSNLEEKWIFFKRETEKGILITINKTVKSIKNRLKLSD